jgi:hypothetical protein
MRTVTPGGPRAVIVESLLLKQLLILKRSRKKAPKLRVIDRILLGLESHSWSNRQPLLAANHGRSPVASTSRRSLACRACGFSSTARS